MAHFSDRVVSFNKLVIAAAVAYAGAVGFAHAQDGPAPSHIHPDGYFSAQGTPANCYLEDHGTVYMDGPCKYLPSDRKGSFLINDGRFEGMAARDNAGAMVGAYYPIDGEHQDKGTFDELHRVGACWVNSTQRICAGKPGERVSPHPVSKATAALANAWLTMKAQCDKDSVGGDKTGDNYPASCTSLQALSEPLTKQGCEMMGDDNGPDAYWTCGGQAMKGTQ
jgi:hypothetical protein